MPRKRKQDLGDLPVEDWTLGFGQGAVGPGSVGPVTRGMAGGLGGILRGLATLPSRALSAAGELQRGGEYDPGPALETAMLGPATSFPMALRGAIDPNLLAALYLRKRAAPEGMTTKSIYDLVSEEGKKRGYIQAEMLDPRTRSGQIYPNTVYVHNVGTFENPPRNVGSFAREANPASHALGAEEIKSLLLGLKKEFPEAERVAGFRISGGRRAAGSEDALVDRFTPSGAGLGDPLINAMMRLPRVSEERMKAYMAKAPKEVDPLSGRASPPNAARETPYTEASRRAFAERVAEWSRPVRAELPPQPMPRGSLPTESDIMRLAEELGRGAARSEVPGPARRASESFDRVRRALDEIDQILRRRGGE